MYEKRFIVALKARPHTRAEAQGGKVFETINGR